jgi:excisionase family DNA binding protein
MLFSHGFISILREDNSMGLLTAREAAEYLHVSLFTLSRIEKDRLLVPFRTPGGHRRYSLEMLNEYLERSRPPETERARRILIVHEGDGLIGLLTKAFPGCRFAHAQDELRVGIKLAEFKPDLVLVNSTMKDTDSKELCRRLNAQNPHLKALLFDGPEPGEEYAEGAKVDAPPIDGLFTNIAAVLGLKHGTETP